MYPFVYGSLVTIGYIAIAAGIMLPIRKFTKIPDELFRKILHFILLGAYIPLVFAFEMWWMAGCFALLLIAILFPVLFFAEKIPMFSSFTNERKKGEFKSSMVLAVGMMAFSVFICWGVFNDRYLVLASIYSWGIGDAFAALIGKKFGKHKITGKFLSGKKSYEGSLSMFICSLISVFVILFIRGNLSVEGLIVIPLVTAIITSLIELYTKDGFDTITCPLGGMISIITLLYLFGGLF